jgi:uncharacterized membrane protein YgcG
MSGAAAVAAVAVVLLPTAAAHADVDDFTFDSFHADMQLTRATDGHAELAITETIIARFPDEDQNRGIVRAIPDDYDGVPLRTTVLSVTDADGEAVPYALEQNGDVLEVATGDDSFVRGVQTYVISYTQRDSIRAFVDTGADEFYRDINGTGWEQPFGEVSASLTIDAAIADAVTGDAACYRGPEGSTQTCEGLQASGDRVSVAERDLAPGENLSVAVGFEAGTFVPGEVQRSAAEQFAIDAAPGLDAAAVGAGGLGVAALAAALVARRRGRDAPGRGTIVAQYDAPDGLSVMQAAHLVSRPATAVPAAIVDLAVAGRLRVVEDDSGYSLELVAPARRDAARQRVIDAVFATDAAPGALVRLGGDTSAVAQRLAALSKQEAVSLRAAGMTTPRATGPAFVVLSLAALAVIAAFALVIFTSSAGTLSPIIAGALGVAFVAAVAAALLWRYGDRLTEAGAEAREHLQGLRDYLRLAEADRIRMLQSPAGAERRGPDGAEVLHLYERLLPYAIIWGIEKDWASVLETHAAETGRPIDWYAGPNGFSSTAFLASFAVTQTSTGTSAWSTSAGGSFSGGSLGGGFSGGGAGGGGGGGR